MRAGDLVRVTECEDKRCLCWFCQKNSNGLGLVIEPFQWMVEPSDKSLKDCWNVQFDKGVRAIFGEEAEVLT